MKIEDIIPRKQLPPVFLDKEFKHFRIANKDKITLDIDGKLATGKRPNMPLYTISELDTIGSIPKANYLQLVPANTPYAILDFDTDKKLPDEARLEQVDYICDKVLNQFDGRIELSVSKLGVHAYIKDKRVKEMSSDPFKFHVTDDKDRRIDIEVFASNAPIILTCDLLEEGVEVFDTVPLKLMKIIQENIKTEIPVTHNNIQLSEIDINEKDLAIITERFTELDTHDRMNIGYGDADDCSTVDFTMAIMLLKAAYGNKEQAYSLLHHWMQRWRPESNCRKTPKAIINKVNRAINSAYAKLQIEGELTVNIEPSLNTQGKTMKEVVMERSRIAGIALEKVSKSESLVHNVFYEGTLNILYARSGSGKTKVAVILTMMIAQTHPEKFIYYYAPDLSLDDILEIRDLVGQKGLSNYFIDQDSIGKEFMQMMETHGGSEDVSNLVFVVDTLKKITSVNNKDGMSKTMGMLKKVTLRGATGIIVAHTNKDGHTISGTAEVEQDSDNVLTVATKYLGEDKMRVTVMASELRCRSRIEPLTLEIERDGFEYEISDEHVNMNAIEAQEKEFERMGNIIEIAQDVVNEYAEKSESLTKTQLQTEIREADAYTGNRKNDILSKMIDKMGENLDITLTRQGRSILCTPYVHTVRNLLEGFNKNGTDEEGNDDSK